MVGSNRSDDGLKRAIPSPESPSDLPRPFVDLEYGTFNLRGQNNKILVLDLEDGPYGARELRKRRQVYKQNELHTRLKQACRTWSNSRSKVVQYSGICGLTRHPHNSGKISPFTRYLGLLLWNPCDHGLGFTMKRTFLLRGAALSSIWAEPASLHVMAATLPYSQYLYAESRIAASMSSRSFTR